MAPPSSEKSWCDASSPCTNAKATVAIQLKNVTEARASRPPTRQVSVSGKASIALAEQPGGPIGSA